jgi:hypothetical protein
VGDTEAVVDVVVLQVADAVESDDVLLAEALNNLDPATSRAAIERAVNRLIEGGLMLNTDNGLDLTAEGRRAAKHLSRFRSSDRSAVWLSEQLGLTSDEPERVWRLSQTAWDLAVAASKERRRTKLSARKEILDGPSNSEVLASGRAGTTIHIPARDDSF